MFRSAVNSALILLLISTVVFNQGDYSQSEDNNEEYPSPEVEGASPRGVFDIFKSKPQKAEDIAIVNGVLGIIAGGKCLIKCVLSITKICTKIFDCLWTCILPKKLATITLPRNIPQDDYTDIKPKDRYSHSSDLKPKDIVTLFDCLSKCLTRYLPRNVNTLFDWLSCITNQCICYA